jgi:hypothetical protein
MEERQSQKPRQCKANPWVWLLSPLIAVLGCGHPPDGPDQALAYAEAVEAALDAPAASQQAVASYPRRRDRRVPIEPVQISLGDWHTLESCAAGGLIAEANSPLGKVRSDFERVMYSRSVLQTAHACEQSLNEKQWAPIAPAMAVKASQYGLERWNAFAVAPTVERSMGRTSTLELALISDAPEHWGRMVEALFPADGEPVDRDAWYAAESALEKSASVGEALRFVLRTTQAFDRVANAVEADRADRNPCLQRDRDVAALMRGHYVNRLQPLMAQGDPMVRRAHAVFGRVASELAPAEGLPPEMASWLAVWSGGESGAFGAYRNATRRHARVMGELLAACGISLGKSTN